MCGGFVAECWIRGVKRPAPGVWSRFLVPKFPLGNAPFLEAVLRPRSERARKQRCFPLTSRPQSAVIKGILELAGETISTFGDPEFNPLIAMKSTSMFLAAPLALAIGFGGGFATVSPRASSSRSDLEKSQPARREAASPDSSVVRPTAADSRAQSAAGQSLPR